jgi:hypothetical protein
MALFDHFKRLFTKQGDQASQFAAYNDVILASILEHEKNEGTLWDIKVNRFTIYKESVVLWPDAQKIHFIHFLLKNITSYYTKDWYDSKNIKYKKFRFQEAYLQHLFRAKLLMSEEEVIGLVQLFLQKSRYSDANVLNWPIGLMLNQVEKQYSGMVLGKDLKKVLQSLKYRLGSFKAYYQEKERLKMIGKLDALLQTSGISLSNVIPTHFLGSDDFAKYANGKIEDLNPQHRNYWYPLIAHAQKASGGKPTQKYLIIAQPLLEQLGIDSFKSMVEDWFLFLIDLKNRGMFYNVYVDGVTIDEIKGFLWMSSLIADKSTLNLITRLAERTYRSMPGMGPVAVAIGNACFFALYKSPGLYGVGQLSRLKFRIKSNAGRKLIEKYLEEAAAEKGIPKYEIEDLAVADYGLQNGQKELQFGEYKVALRITGIGKTETQWYKPDGSLQKSIPASVKTQFSAELKDLRNEAKEIEQTLITQKDRLDRMLRVNRQIKWGYFQTMLFSHSLLSYLYEPIIWRFEKEGTIQTGIYLNGRWTKEKGETFIPDEACTVSLWHPVGESIATIQAWRNFLQTQQIQQPFKQAFREVYLLTEAEVNTHVYSNRMAAHVLKQHQFNSLAKGRGWKYSLVGCYDDGRDNEAASLDLPEYGLRAEFWVNEINADHAYNDAGIWNYVATDQVRFVKKDNQPCNLVEVPPIIFSEVMRDVDLFVGVASVGNDPTWRDSGGIPAYRDYWQSYSFGDLSELAKTRKEILAQLVPRLKISKVAEIKDRFLVVKGKLRTYKIHIGSTNILMEPNDQYLCIVPDRSKPAISSNVFLPFEGDTGLSIILSKAFLLAEDDKIEDGTIVSQIGGK